MRVLRRTRAREPSIFSGQPWQKVGTAALFLPNPAAMMSCILSRCSVIYAESCCNLYPFRSTTLVGPHILQVGGRREREGGRESLEINSTSGDLKGLGFGTSVAVFFFVPGYAEGRAGGYLAFTFIVICG